MGRPVHRWRLDHTARAIDLVAKRSALGHHGGAPGPGRPGGTAQAGPGVVHRHLDLGGQAGLRNKGNLTVTAKLTVTPPSGKAYNTSGTVTLKR